jgi:hypothetical protein
MSVPSCRGIFAFALLALTACASVGPRERMAARLEEFERHAGAPVKDFRLWNMDSWEALGPETLAVWTRPNEAWLLTVDLPCRDLEFANAIALTSSVGRVHSRFDSVVFEHQRCRITEIRPVDGRALKAERHARAETDSGS